MAKSTANQFFIQEAQPIKLMPKNLHNVTNLKAKKNPI